MCVCVVKEYINFVECAVFYVHFVSNQRFVKYLQLFWLDKKYFWCVAGNYLLLNRKLSQMTRKYCRIIFYLNSHIRIRINSTNIWRNSVTHDVYYDLVSRTKIVSPPSPLLFRRSFTILIRDRHTSSSRL